MSWVAVAVALVGGCSNGPPPAMPGLVVLPQAPMLPVGAKARFTAIETQNGAPQPSIDAGTIAWTVDNPAIVSIDADGNATALAVGTATVTATAITLVASTTVTVTPAQVIALDVEPTKARIPVGLTQAFTATGHFTDGTMADLTASVEWASSDTSVATVDGTGAASGVAEGTATVTATLPAPGNGDGGTAGSDGGMPAGVTGSALLTVTAASITHIDVTPPAPTLAAGTSRQLVATATFSDGTTGEVTSLATWSSSASAVAMVSNGAGMRGLVDGVMPGTADVMATLGGTVGTATVTVSAATLDRIDITPANPTLPAGTRKQLRAIGTFSDMTTQDLTAQCAWSTSDPTIALVDDMNMKGMATGVALGLDTVTATYAGVTATTPLFVSPATLQSIEVTPTNPQIPVGTTVQLRAVGTYSDATTVDLSGQVAWSSGDNTIATVDAKGLASGVAVGAASITATLGAVAGSDLVVVSAAQLVAIDVTPTDPLVAKGTTKQFVATGTYSDKSTQDITTSVTWASSDDTVASIANAQGQKGLATGLMPGSVTVTASLGDISGATDLTVTSATLASISVTPPAPTIAKGTTEQFEAIGTYTDNTTQNLTSLVTWSTSDKTVATISNAAGTQGLATAVATGTTAIAAAYGNVSGAAKLTVTAATLVSIALTPANPTIAKGTTAQFTATGTYSDNSTQDLSQQVTWASSDNTVATLSNAGGTQGLATATGVGAATVSATLSGVTGTTKLTVTSATLSSITVTPSSPTIASGTTQQFQATGIYSDNSTQNLTSAATWSSSDSTVATVSNAAGTQGLATGVAKGSVTVTAAIGSVSGTATLAVTSATLVSISVSPTSPAIAKGTTQQFKATGAYSDGSTQDLTASATWSSSNTTVATVSNASQSQGLATAAAQGQTTLSAALGNVSGATTLTVTAATLTSITVTPTNPLIAKGTSEQFQAIGTYSDNTTQNLSSLVTWASSNTTVATVSNAAGSQGLTSGLSPGSSSISATYGGVTGSTTLTVTSATIVSITVTPTNPSIAKGTTVQFTATGTYTDATSQDITAQATWSTSNSSVASISNAAGSQGLASGLGTGSVTVSATFNSVSGTTGLTVTAATLVSIAVTPTNPSTAKGTSVQFTATGTYSDNSTQNLTLSASWTSSNTGVATVSNSAGSQGKATGAGTGTATITATVGGVSGTTVLTVTAATLSSIAITPTNPVAAKGTTVQLTATGTYSDNSTQNLTAQVTWASSAPAVATVSNAGGSQGLATAVSQGQTNVTATLGGVSGTTVLTVTAATLSSISVTPTNPSIAKGTSQQFAAVGTYSDGSTQDLTSAAAWSSSNTSVATVSNASGSQGKATGVGTGTSTITATASGVSGSTVLTVTAATLTSISVTPTNPTIAKGTSQQFTATGIYSDASTQDLTATVTWASSATSVATVSNAAGSQGLAASVATGTTTISATAGSVSGSTVLTVTAATITSIAVEPANPTVAKGTSVQLQAVATYSDGTTQTVTSSATWSSSNTGVATVSNATGTWGLVSGVGAGTATVGATVSGVTGSTVVTVTSATLVSIAITPANPTIAKGTKLQMTATGTFSDGSTQDLTTQVTWASSNTAVATVSGASGSQGLLTAVGAGMATIAATLNGVKGSTVVTVTPAVLVSIAITPANPTIAVKTIVQLKATGTYSDGSTQNLTTQVTWSSSNTGVATVSNAKGSQGIATGVAAGTATITAALGGVSGTTGITVTSATLVSIAVTPANATMAVGTTQQYKATGTFSDGSTQDITIQASWSTSNKKVAVVNNAGRKGLVWALATGTATISATLFGIVGSTGVTVQ